MIYDDKNGYQPKKGNIINQPPNTGSKVSLERKYETSNKYNDMVMLTNKCECYEEREVFDYSLNFDRKLIGICNGTKEREECYCKGNRAKCDFYPKVREKAEQSSQEYRDKKELEFYRWWVTEHNLNVEVATAFEKYLKENS